MVDGREYPRYTEIVIPLTDPRRTTMPRYAITARYNDQTTEEVASHDPEIESLTIERIPEVAS